MATVEPYIYNATIVRIIDGDTVVVDCDLGFHLNSKMTLRLLGINAPELHAPDEPTRERARAATAALTAMLKGPVRIRTVKADAFGRYLADIYTLDGVFINAEMIAQGHAVAFR